MGLARSGFAQRPSASPGREEEAMDSERATNAITGREAEASVNSQRLRVQICCVPTTMMMARVTGNSMTENPGNKQVSNGAPEVHDNTGSVDAPQAEATRWALPYPGFGQALILIVALIGIEVLLTFPFVIMGLYRHPAALALPTLIGTAVIVVYGFSRTGASSGEVFPFSATRVRVSLSLLLTVIGLLIINLKITGFLVKVIPPPKGFAQLMADMVRGNQITWASILTLALVLPVSEEFLFRGLILHGFLSRYGVRKAILGSALLFALLHGNPWQFVPAVLMGVVLGWCLVRTRSLIPCLFAHIANNSIAFLTPRLELRLPAAASWMTLHPAWVNIGGLVLALSGIYLLKRLFSAQSESRTASA